MSDGGAVSRLDPPHGLPPAEGSSAADEFWMLRALDLARSAMSTGEIPVGAVIVKDSEMIAGFGNRTVADCDPSAHAELLTLRRAAQATGDWRLSGCTLYVTLEPCAMCAGAIVLSRVDRVVFGAWDDKAGMAGSIEDLLRHPRLNHRPEVRAGVRAQECGEILREFFRGRRQ